MGNDIIQTETLNQELDSLTKAKALVISSNEDYSAADAFSVGLLALEKAIKSDFKDAKDKAFLAHRAICAQEAGHLEKIQEARDIIRPKLLAWEELRHKEAVELQARLEAELRKKAEDRALKEAEAAEVRGDKATAEAILEAPVQVAPVVLTPTLPQRKTKIPEAWTYRVTNPNLIPREYLTIDAMKLNGMARATKGSVVVAGIEFYDKNKLSSGEAAYGD